MAYTPYQQAVRNADNAMWAVENHHNRPNNPGWGEELDQLEDAYEAAEANKKQAFREAIENGEQPTWIQ